MSAPDAYLSQGAGPGNNPNYYADTASLASYQPQTGSDAPAQGSHPPPPPGGPPPGQQPEAFYRPPSYAPPTDQQGQQGQYPPPPPGGPPPIHTYNPQDHGYMSGGLGEGGSSPTETLPGYTPAPASLDFPPDTNEKPPLGDEPSHGSGSGELPLDQQNTSVSGLAPPPGGTSYSAAPEQPAPGKTKKGFGERLYQWSVKAGVPINKVTNKLGSESFWPTTMDKECDKAARILKSFCKDGFYTSKQPAPEPGHPTSPGPKSPGRTLVKIPEKAIQQARGLAIFTTFRTGFHISGAGGSGVVLARLPDGRWSPPSGFHVHTLGAGFLIGLDIYDCVCVLNTDEAVRAFTRPRVSLGGELAVAAGPVGAGSQVAGALGKGMKPVWSYMKSRGLYAGIQADGTIIIQRPDANAEFYGGQRLPVEQILRGDVPEGDMSDRHGVVPWPMGAAQLTEVLRAAEGKKADEGVLQDVGGPTPGDLAGTEGVQGRGGEGEGAPKWG